MKKNFILLIVAANVSFAQLPQRVSLLEEFTGENCFPCTLANPDLDNLLSKPTNTNKIIAIKWAVPRPSAPSDPLSLYLTNKTEIDWRYKPAAQGGYSYTSQYVPTASVTSGILNAPTNLIDGKYQWLYGTPSNHPYYLTDSVINAASSYTTPFSIIINPIWDPSLTSAVVTVTVQSASSFTTNGPLVFRLCLVERFIDFTFPLGSNGETHFEEVVRKSYPSIQNGKSLPISWTPGQIQTYTIYCQSPSYIKDYTQQAFVGFIQDDSNMQVWQAARTPRPLLENDISVNKLIIENNITCTTAITPTVNLTNVGSNSITFITAQSMIDGVAQAPINWIVNLASQSTTNITLPTYSVTPGNHTFSLTVTNVSGGDLATYNNNAKTNFGVASTYFSSQVSEDFAGIFPPQNWFLLNSTNDSWALNTNVGNNDSKSAFCDFAYSSINGSKSELYIKPLNLSGINFPALSFDYAYTNYAANIRKDSLAVLVSTNCGQTWSSVFAKGGVGLQTTLPVYSTFTPTASDWITNVIPLTTFGNQPEVLIKFVATSQRGNDLFLDNVNITASSGISKHAQNIVSFDVFPNPAVNLVTIKISTLTKQTATIKLFNALGCLVYDQATSFTVGTNELKIDTSLFPSGMYNLSIITETGITSKKIVINK